MQNDINHHILSCLVPLSMTKSEQIIQGFWFWLSKATSTVGGYTDCVGGIGGWLYVKKNGGWTFTKCSCGRLKSFPAEFTSSMPKPKFAWKLFFLNLRL